MARYKNKLILNFALCLILVAVVCLIAACGNDGISDGVKTGEDEYGRVYGEIYSVDEYESGIYRIPYEIEDTSEIGKSMISQYCLEYVSLDVDGGQYVLTFYCKSNMLNDVKLSVGGEMQTGESADNGENYGYAFEIDRSALDDKMGMECTVKLMNKTVAFSIRADLSQAVLVG